MTVLGATPNTLATSFAVMGLPRSSSFIMGPFFRLTVMPLKSIKLLFFWPSKWLQGLKPCYAVLTLVPDHQPDFLALLAADDRTPRNWDKPAVLFKDFRSS